MSSGYNAIGNPITPQGTVVVNGQYDRVLYQRRIGSNDIETPYKDGQPEDYGLNKHELLFHWSESNKMRSMGVNDPDLTLFSSCNRLPAKNVDWKEQKNEIRKNCTFIGVNLTQIGSPMKGSNHVAVVVAGIATVFNTGTENIEIGQRVVWDVAPVTGRDPVQQTMPAGVPKNKKLFQTLPYDTAAKKHEYEQMYLNALNSANSDFDLNSTMQSLRNRYKPELNNFEAFFKDAVMPFLEAHAAMKSEVDNRVIGTSLTRSRPGEPMDILVRYNRMC